MVVDATLSGCVPPQRRAVKTRIVVHQAIVPAGFALAGVSQVGLSDNDGAGDIADQPPAA